MIQAHVNTKTNTAKGHYPSRKLLQGASLSAPTAWWFTVDNYSLLLIIFVSINQESPLVVELGGPEVDGTVFVHIAGEY